MKKIVFFFKFTRSKCKTTRSSCGFFALGNVTRCASRMHDVQTYFRKGLLFPFAIVFNHGVTGGGGVEPLKRACVCTVFRDNAMAGRFKTTTTTTTTTTYDETAGPCPCCNYRRGACRAKTPGQRDVGPSARDGRPGAYTKRPSVPAGRRAYATRVMTSLAPSVAERRRRFASGGRRPGGHLRTTHNGRNALCRVRFPVRDWPRRPRASHRLSIRMFKLYGPTTTAILYGRSPKINRH